MDRITSIQIAILRIPIFEILINKQGIALEYSYTIPLAIWILHELLSGDTENKVGKKYQ